MSRFLVFVMLLMEASMMQASPKIFIPLYEGNLSIMNPVSGDIKTIQIDADRRGYALAYANKLCTLYIGMYDGRHDTRDFVYAIDVRNDNIITSIQVGSEPSGLALSPLQDRLYVVNQTDENISVIDTATNQTIGDPIPTGHTPFDIIVHPSQPFMFVSNAGDNTISVFNTQTLELNMTISVDTDPKEMGMTSDGSLLFVANSGSDSVSVIDVDTLPNSTPNSVQVGDTPQSLIVSPNDDHVYIANRYDNNISVINLGKVNGNWIMLMGNPIAAGREPWGIDISKDGNTLYVLNMNSGTVSVIRADTGETIETVATGRYPASSSETADDVCMGSSPAIMMYLLN